MGAEDPGEGRGLYHPTQLCPQGNNNNNNNNNIAEMALFLNAAGYLIEERRRWPVITASRRVQHSK